MYRTLRILVATLLIGLSLAGMARAADSFQVKSRDAILRALTDEKKTIGKVTRKIDLQAITFEFNSAKLTGQAQRQLQELGLALQSDQLRDKTFLVAGHTDARGSPDYNDRLSKQRADAVRDYLVTSFGLDPAHLSTVGYGQHELLADYAPQAPMQRRVEIRLQ